MDVPLTLREEMYEINWVFVDFSCICVWWYVFNANWFSFTWDYDLIVHYPRRLNKKKARSF